MIKIILAERNDARLGLRRFLPHRSSQHLGVGQCYQWVAVWLNWVRIQDLNPSFSPLNISRFSRFSSNSFKYSFDHLISHQKFLLISISIFNFYIKIIDVWHALWIINSKHCFHWHLLSFRLEIVGRFPSEEEATQLNISFMTPVWLSTRSDDSHLTSEMLTRLRRLREGLS